MNILQLRQSQVEGLPFTLAKDYVQEGVEIMDKPDKYLMISTLVLLGGNSHPLVRAYNIMLRMAGMAGFTHLMLIYGE